MSVGVSECYHCTLNHPTFATGIVKPETYIRPQGYCLRHTTECQNLQSMSYPIDLNQSLCHRLFILVPVADVLISGLSRKYAEHISLAGRRCGKGGCLAWMVQHGRRRIRGVRQLAIQDRETTVAEDIGLVGSVQRGLASRGYRPGPLVIDPGYGVNSEHSIAVLQNWMRQASDTATG